MHPKRPTIEPRHLRSRWPPGSPACVRPSADSATILACRLEGATKFLKRLPIPPLKEIEQALRRLRSDIEALGSPDADSGAALAFDIVAGVRRSLAAIERAGGRADLIGAFSDGSEFSAFAYPFGLLLLLGGVGESAQVAIYLDDPVRDATLARLSRLLERRPEVAKIGFETKAEACRNFKKLFADQEALLEDLDCDVLPASFRVGLTPGAFGSSLRDALINQIGVDNVVVQPALADFLVDRSILTQGDLLDLDPIRAEAPRHAECTSLAALGPSGPA